MIGVVIIWALFGSAAEVASAPDKLARAKTEVTESVKPLVPAGVVVPVQPAFQQKPEKPIPGGNL